MHTDRNTAQRPPLSPPVIAHAAPGGEEDAMHSVRRTASAKVVLMRTPVRNTTTRTQPAALLKMPPPLIVGGEIP